MEAVIKLAGLILGATAINLPLGFLRKAHERYSFGWFFYVHISIPLIILLRLKAAFAWQVMPLTVGGALIGQFLGGELRGKAGFHE